MTRSMPQLPLALSREEKMEEYEVSSVIRGFHVYQRLWSPSLEEQLECLREAGNDKDRYAVAKCCNYQFVLSVLESIRCTFLSLTPYALAC